MDSTKTNDATELMRLSLSTFLNIGQMARYRYLYTLGKELQNNSPIQTSDSELTQNRNNMIYHTCLAGLGILGLLAIGISGLSGRK